MFNIFVCCCTPLYSNKTRKNNFLYMQHSALCVLQAGRHTSPGNVENDTNKFFTCVFFFQHFDEDSKYFCSVPIKKKEKKNHKINNFQI